MESRMNKKSRENNGHLKPSWDLHRTGLHRAEGVVTRTDSRGREVERHRLSDVVSADCIQWIPPRRTVKLILGSLLLAVASPFLIPSPGWSWILAGVFLVCAVVLVWLGRIQHLNLKFSTGRIRVRVRDVGCEAMQFAMALESLAALRRPPVPYEYKTNEEMADWDDPSLTVELAMRARGRLERDGAESLNEAERNLLALNDLTAEVNSGGFAGWVRIGDPSILHATPHALQTLGLDEAAEIVRQALSPFGEEGLSDDPEEQTKQVDAVMDEADDLWMRLGREYTVELDNEVVTRSLAYAKRHMNEVREFP
jgi:hypothetical protein